MTVAAHRSVDEQIAIAVNAGIDVLSGLDRNKQIVALVRSGKISEARLDQAVRRQLRAQFQLGLFEDPYVDADRAAYVVGNRATFGVRDAALMDVLTGRFKPQGTLPFALAGNARAIVRQASDAPGYDRADTLFPFGFGLTY